MDPCPLLPEWERLLHGKLSVGHRAGDILSALSSERCQLDLLPLPSDLLRMYLSMHKTLTFSWKPVKTFQWQTGGLFEEGRRDLTMECWGRGSFNSKPFISLYSGSNAGGLRGSFQETLLQSTHEAPQTERSPLASKNLFKKL